MTYTIDMLLAELGQELPLGNGERYRRPIIRHVRQIFSKIGFEKIAHVYIQSLEVRNGYLEFPEYVLTPWDCGFEPDRMSGEKLEKVGLRSKNELAFVLTPFGMEFPNLLTDETIYLMFESLPMDDQEQPYIPEDVYQCCYDFAFAKLLATFPQHYRYPNQMILEQQALTSADRARALLNKRARPAHNRLLRKHL